MARELLQSGAKAELVVAIVLKELEDDPLTNAGYGSNLTIDGVVEGDATIIDQYGRFGSVSGVTRKFLEQPLRLSLISSQKS
jgi:taspase (threonine aspartase 1)